MPPTIPLPLMTRPEDHPTPEAKYEMEAEIKIMKVQILAMAPRIWRQHKANLSEEYSMSRRSKNRPELPRNQERLRPYTDFTIRDQEHKEGTLLRDTQGRVRSIEWTEYSYSLARSSDQDRAIAEGPKKYSRKDAIEALFKSCRKTFQDIQKQAQKATSDRGATDSIQP